MHTDYSHVLTEAQLRVLKSDIEHLLHREVREMVKKQMENAETDIAPAAASSTWNLVTGMLKNVIEQVTGTVVTSPHRPAVAPSRAECIAEQPGLFW